jgi:hypothetical protein
MRLNRDDVFVGEEVPLAVVCPEHLATRVGNAKERLVAKASAFRKCARNPKASVCHRRIRSMPGCLRQVFSLIGSGC